MIGSRRFYRIHFVDGQVPAINNDFLDLAVRALRGQAAHSWPLWPGKSVMVSVGLNFPIFMLLFLRRVLSIGGLFIANSNENDSQ